MNNGTVLRLRNIRVYGSDPRNYVEYRPDEHRDKSSKRVFVCVLLGTEGYQIVTPKGDQVMEPLDVKAAMNRLGWYSDDQIRALGKSGERIATKLQEAL